MCRLKIPGGPTRTTNGPGPARVVQDVRLAAELGAEVVRVVRARCSRRKEHGVVCAPAPLEDRRDLVAKVPPLAWNPYRAPRQRLRPCDCQRHRRSEVTMSARRL